MSRRLAMVISLFAFLMLLVSVFLFGMTVLARSLLSFREPPLRSIYRHDYVLFSNHAFLSIATDFLFPFLVFISWLLGLKPSFFVFLLLI